MKYFLPLILFHLLSHQMLFSQNANSKVVIIDEEKVKYVIDEAVHLEVPGSDQLRIEQSEILAERIKQLKIDYQLIHKRLNVWCISPKRYEVYKNYLNVLNKQLFSYEAETAFVILKYTQWYDTAKTALVINHVKSFCKQHQIDFAISKNKSTFQSKGFPDITDEIIASIDADKKILVNEATKHFRSALSALKTIDESHQAELLFHEWEYEGLQEEIIEDVELELERLRGETKN